MSKQSGGTKTTSWRNKATRQEPTVLGLKRSDIPAIGTSRVLEVSNPNRIQAQLDWMRDSANSNSERSLGLVGNEYIILHMKGDSSSNGSPYDITLQEHDDVLPKGLRASQIRAIDHWVPYDRGGRNELSTRNADVVTERWHNGERMQNTRETTFYRRKKK